MLDLNYFEIQISCPKCKYTIDIYLIDVKNEDVVFCHNCKASIQLKDSDASSYKGIKEINNTFNELKNTLKKLGK